MYDITEIGNEEFMRCWSLENPQLMWGDMKIYWNLIILYRWD